MPRDYSYVTDEFRKRISEKLKGVKRSKETRLKISKAKIGVKMSLDARSAMSIAAIKRHYKPWETLNYSQRHNRIRRLYGDPKKCENCGDERSIFYDWANVSGKYKRNRHDWKRLCRPCHGEMDSEKRGHKRSPMTAKSRVNNQSKKWRI